MGLSFEFLMSSFFKKFVTGYCLKIVVYVRAVLWEQQIMRGGDVYSPSKERVLRHGGQVYSVSPFAMLWNNDTYYLVGFHDHRQQITKFRVDRIVQMEITDEAAVKRPKDFDVSEFFTQEFSMLNGKECMVTLLCENILMNSIIDRFGEDVPVQTVDAAHFSAQVTVDLSSNFYGWVFASAGKMKIAEPQEAVEGFRKMLESFGE